MTTYTCSVCNFNTYKKYNYNIHNISPKHLENLSERNMVTQGNTNYKHKVTQNSALVTQINNEQNLQHKCSNCGDLFSYKNSLYRHRKHFS
jgi:hypothetical protein